MGIYYIYIYIYIYLLSFIFSYTCQRFDKDDKYDMVISLNVFTPFNVQ